MADITINLQRIEGLGARWETLLTNAGIEGVRDLATANASELQAIGPIEDWRAESWIEDAQALVEQEDASGGEEVSESVAQTRSEGRASPRDEPEGEGGDATPDSEFERLYRQLTPSQKKVVQEYPFHATKADAAREVGLHPSTLYQWDDKVWECAEALLDERAKGIQSGMSALSPHAIKVLRRALDPDQSVSRVESETAQYLINQLEGKPTQKSEVDVSGGIDVSDADRDELDSMLSHLDDEDDEKR